MYLFVDFNSGVAKMSKIQGLDCCKERICKCPFADTDAFWWDALMHWCAAPIASSWFAVACAKLCKIYLSVTTKLMYCTSFKLQPNWCALNWYVHYTPIASSLFAGHFIFWRGRTLATLYITVCTVPTSWNMYTMHLWCAALMHCTLIWKIVCPAMQYLSWLRYSASQMKLFAIWAFVTLVQALCMSPGLL